MRKFLLYLDYTTNSNYSITSFVWQQILIQSSDFLFWEKQRYLWFIAFPPPPCPSNLKNPEYLFVLWNIIKIIIAPWKSLPETKQWSTKSFPFTTRAHIWLLFFSSPANSTCFVTFFPDIMCLKTCTSGLSRNGGVNKNRNFLQNKNLVQPLTGSTWTGKQTI